jgi:hypothetical protein
MSLDRPELILTEALGSAALVQKVMAALSEAGLACLPLEPTPAMVDAGWAPANEEDAARTWRAMAAAAIATARGNPGP